MDRASVRTPATHETEKKNRQSQEHPYKKPLICPRTHEFITSRETNCDEQLSGDLHFMDNYRVLIMADRMQKKKGINLERD